jgi:16S rRNA (cytosine967-C5)-methyltransferase
MAERPTPAGRGSRVDPARLAALEVLKAVRVDDAYANLALARVLAEHGLTGRDAAFATELVSGTIRLQGTYDAIIDACLTKPRLEAKVRDVLRLGAHQLLSMRVPDHAAISSSVELARARVGVGPVGLVNAVLRKVAAHDLDGWIRRVAPDPGTDPFGYAAVAHSHPRWVVEELADALASAVQLEDLLAADNAPPRVVLAARPGLSTVEELVAAGGTPGTLSPYAVELSGGDPATIPAVAEGRAGVQDEGSQLVATTLADAPLEGRDERWLDVCAGPGGKSALLAALAAQRGALLLANELQPHRARLVARGTRAAAAGLLGVVTGDGTRPPWREATFDRVLVDAPCSGLGALRRRPESRWRRSERDLEALVPLQRALLGHALDAVRPGGVVVYATCSPVLAETSEVVDAVVAGRDDVRVAAVRQLWPHRDGTDAMFIATLLRS